MFLAIDIGNTETTIGAFERGTLKGSFRISSRPSITPDELGIAVLDLFRIYFGQKAKVEKAAIASVVPSLTKINIDMIKSYFGVSAEVLTHKVKIDFKLAYDDPSQLGTDRLANLIATRRLYGYPAIIVDIGTATKYDVLNESGDYIGGIIAPGPASSAKNLFEAGARLFPVELEKPELILGTNSMQCLKSGIYNGFLGQLQYLIKRIKDELNYRDIKLIVTGGYAETFSSELSPPPKVDTGLTLKGIKIVFDR